MANNPAAQTPDKDKFAPEHVTADPKAHQDHRGEFSGRDLPRGSEEETRGAARGRG